LPQTAPTPQINLEEPIAGCIEALGKKQIRLVLGVDVWQAPVVDQNLNWLSETWQRDDLGRDLALRHRVDRDSSHAHRH
jgi:hypothetical protein